MYACCSCKLIINDECWYLYIFIQIGLSSKYLYHKTCTIPYFINLISNWVNFADRGHTSLTYARYLWSLSSEDSLACHTYRDTGHLFIMVVSEYQLHSRLMPRILQWSCHYLFLINDLDLSRLGIEDPNLRLHDESPKNCATAAATYVLA